MNKKEFLKEKLTNFSTFVKSAVNLNNKMRNDLIKLTEISVEEFTSVVMTHIVPHKDKVDAYVDKMLEEYGVNKSDVKTEDFNKLKRYIEMFIDIVTK